MTQLAAMLTTRRTVTKLVPLILLLGVSDAQSSLNLSPSLGGGITFPLFSGGHQKDQWAEESSPSSHVVTVVPPPNKISPSQEYKSFSGSFFQPHDVIHSNSSKADYLTMEKYLAGGGYPSSSGGGYSPGSPPGTSQYSSGSRNNTSRFFSLNTARQTLDLGISFTVPFLSIPMSSIMSIGQNFSDSTTSALNSLMAINWPSLLIIGGAILAASLLLPQLASWITSAIGSSSSSYTTSSYGRIMDREGAVPLPVAPFTSILNQLDDALAQYDLDSTSCMQRAVCSYVAGSEESVQEGDADASELIVSGLARSSWMQSFIGQGSIAKAVELGRKQGHCHRQFPKCPFSLPGVMRFLIDYASLIPSGN
ncbi:uncharacterized protein LOC135199872 isoform X2 [Macrobrachium nipponense]|uniref:uncharacterized protein LOC135199872 isoform X2 n=1 Tax=Macrobrachium nipponense TaxID=159736 RepID=UPI0030C8750A